MSRGCARSRLVPITSAGSSIRDMSSRPTPGPSSAIAASSACVSLCSRSIRILQRRPGQSFPGKIRLLGVASLNLVSVGMGQTIAALEATPKIWDLAAAWLVLDELECPIHWLERDPSQLSPGQDLAQVSFPMIAAGSQSQLSKFLPWGRALLQP